VLSAFISSLRSADLRRKISSRWASLSLIASVRPCRPRCQLSERAAVHQRGQQREAGQIYSLINLFSGGALLKLTVFAVGVMPYITASIIVQLLTVVIPL